MPTSSEIIDESRRFMCNLANDADRFFDYVARGTSVFPLVRPLNTGANNLRERIIQAACQGQPPNPRPGDDLGERPPTEGQCPTDYRITATVTSFFNGQLANENLVQAGSQLFRGPIESVFINAAQTDIFVRHNNGQETDLVSGSNSNLRLENLRNIVIERADGQADDCGGGEPTPPRYEGPIGPPQPDPNNPGGPPIEPPPGTIIPRPPEYNGPDFPIIIPFVYIDNDVEVNFDVDIDLEFKRCCNRTPGRRPRLPRQPGDDTPGIPRDPVSPPESPGDPPPPETEAVLVGVIIKTTIESNNLGETTRFGDGDVPDLFFPRVASVVFALQIDRANVWTNPISVNVLSAFIPYQGDFFPYTYEVKPALGFSCDVTPVYLDKDPLPEVS